jgi:hypothetical protein
MSGWRGDIAVGDTIRGCFNTRAAATGAPITLAGTPLLRVYKDDGTTEDDSGITLNVDFDSRTGLHLWEIDTSADGTFYSAGANFAIVITQGTVDGVSVVGYCVGEFSIENRGAARFRRSVNTIVTGTVGAASSTTSIVTSSLSPAAAVDDQFIGRIVIFDKDTTTANLRGQATDITDSTSAGVLTCTALTTAPVSGDTFIVV